MTGKYSTPSQSPHLVSRPKNGARWLCVLCIPPAETIGIVALRTRAQI